MVKSLSDPQLTAAVDAQDYPKIIEYLSAYINDHPQNIMVLQQLGNAYYQLKDYNNAITYYRKYADIDQSATIHYQLGMAYFNADNFQQASEYFKQVLSLDENFDGARAHLAKCYYQLRQFTQTLEQCEKLLLRGDRSVFVIEALAACYFQVGKLKEAVFYARWASELPELDYHKHVNLALLLLAAENYEEGWFHFRWVTKTPDIKKDFPMPQWHGESLVNKSLLVYADQGYGDVLQFIRFIPQLKKLQGKIVLICMPQLTRLFQSIKGIDQIISGNTNLQHTDYYCYLSNLPEFFKIEKSTIASTKSYLSVDASIQKKFLSIIKATPKLNVGIVWSGNQKLDSSLKRTVPLELWAPIFACKNVQFYSLQKGAAAQQLKNIKQKVIDLDPSIEDFADTAACIMRLDLVITIDTSVAHLAGALGRPVWTMLIKSSDWRWGVHADTSTPWYPSMRLFRQDEIDDWPPVIEKVAKALASFKKPKKKVHKE